MLRVVSMDVDLPAPGLRDTGVGYGRDMPDASTAVDLTLPADAQLMRIARLVASGLASLGGFDVDEIDDVRIGIDELCTGLMDVSDGDEVNLELSLAGDCLAVEARMRGDGPLPPAGNPLCEPILSAVADQHSWSTVEGRVIGRLEKRRTGQPPS